MKTRSKRNYDRKSLPAGTVKKAAKHPLQKLTLPNLVGFVFLFLTSLIAITILSYQIAYMGKIYPGIKIAGVNVGNKSPAEANFLLETKLTDFKKAGLAFAFKNEVKNYSLADLEVGYNLELATQQAYRIGREANILSSLIQKAAAWNNHFDLDPQPTFNETKLQTVFNYFAQQITKKPQAAKIRYQNNTLDIDPPVGGEVLDTILARKSVGDTLNSFSISPILLDTQAVNPTLSASEIRQYRENIAALLKNPIKLTFNNKTWELGGDKLAGVLSFTNAGTSDFINFELMGQNYDLKKVAVNLADGTQTNLDTLSLDSNLLADFVSGIAKEIDQDPQNARFNFTDNRVTVFTPSRDGQKLDTTDTISAVNNLFVKLQKNKSENSLLNLKVVVTKAKISTESVNNLGIKELIGQGLSTFYHSIPNRASNIALAASRVNGTLVAPGDTFSMYKAIGEVDSITGYKEAYIISQGRTQLDFGGGVCQVSTTLFRAALNSGLPIVERHPHAYRVGYYEQNSPAGIDASVYFPRVDFQFKNDTQNHILIQTVFDGARSALTFNFYGTRDGRQVSLSKPTISNQIAPPPDLHQDDPTLPVGTVKQVDFSAWGATASFSRTVTKNGETISKDNFYSKYQPWRAIFLHGTKTG